MRFSVTAIGLVLVVAMMLCGADRANCAEKYNVHRLTVLNGNVIRGIEDSVVWRQSFNGTCGVDSSAVCHDSIGISKEIIKKNEANLKIEAKIDSCDPDGLDPPKVTYDWKYEAADNSATPPIRGSDRKGKDVELKLTASGASWLGTVEVATPEEIGVYKLTLTFTMVGKKGCKSKQTITRTLYATALKTVIAEGTSANRRIWYERGCVWAAGVKGEGDDLKEATLIKVRQGFYANNESPQIVYRNSGPWTNLIPTRPAPNNQGQCFAFSDVMEAICKVLGVDGLRWVRVDVDASGTNEDDVADTYTFITQVAPSCDPNFRGSARSDTTADGTENRYIFISHSLRKFKGKYHDATFNGEYPKFDSFIRDWQIKKGDFGVAKPWTRGGKVTVLTDRVGNDYDTKWGFYKYKDIPAAAPVLMPSPWEAVIAGVIPPGESPLLSERFHFSGGMVFFLVDDNFNGIYDALAADIPCEATEAGDYGIFGILMQGDSILTSGARVYDQAPQLFRYSGPPGIFTAHLEFSGEAIYERAMSGPYTLAVYAMHLPGAGDTTGINEVEDSLFYDTPSAYPHSLFGELGAHIVSATEQGIDTDGDVEYNVLRATVTLNVRVAGLYQVVGSLNEDTVNTVATANARESLSAGVQVIELDFSGQEIRKRGLSGPYELSVSLQTVDGTGIEAYAMQTSAYSASQFDMAMVVPEYINSEFGMDLDGSTLYDVLRIELALLADSAGTYQVSGGLSVPVDSGESFVVADTIVEMINGYNFVPLDFSGREIRAYGADGPYTLTFVGILDGLYNRVEFAEPGYATSAYSTSEFDAFCEVNYCAEPTDIGAVPYSSTSTTCCAEELFECVPEYGCAGNCRCSGPAIAYRFEVAAAATYSVEALGPNSTDEQIMIYTDCQDPLGTCVASSDLLGSNIDGESLEWDAVPGTFYIATSTRGECGDITLNITESVVPIAVSNLVIRRTPSTSNNIRLNWGATNGATYRIYRSISLTNIVQPANLIAEIAGTTFTDIGVLTNPTQRFYYAVTAVIP